MQRIYLDHNAGAPPCRQAVQAMQRFLDRAGNPSSVHREGREARAALEDARERVARLISARPAELVFTSGATEANTLALVGSLGGGSARHLVISAIEHPSVTSTGRWLARRGARVSSVAPTASGLIETGAVLDAVRDDTVLVSLQAANHETGVLQPVEELASRLRSRRIRLHVDAAQVAGRMPLDVHALGADLVTLSGHKLGGPAGTGVLWIRPEVAVEPLFHGGSQERGRRAGTENVVGIVGLGAAASEAVPTPARIASIAALRDRLEAGLRSAWSGAVVHGAAAARLPNTSCIGFPGLDGEGAVMRLDLEGVAVSLGAACASGGMRPSPVLRSMAVAEDLARASLRLSLGPATTVAEVDRALGIFQRCIAPAGVAT